MGRQACQAPIRLIKNGLSIAFPLRKIASLSSRSTLQKCKEKTRACIEPWFLRLCIRQAGQNSLHFFEKLLAQPLTESFGQRGNNLEHVADDSVAGHLEDRRLAVAVNRHNHFTGAHAGLVLDCA